jgi:hypothetical protein
MTLDNNDILYCYNHPKRETHLRCNKCERPICASCAVLTPTGYRCKECVRGLQKVFDTAQWWDYPAAVVVSFVLSLIASVVVRYIGFFAIILSFFVGIGVAEAVRFVLHRRRSRNMPMIVAIASFLGAIALSLRTISLLLSGMAILGLSVLIWPGLFAVVIAGSAFYRLKGIRI